MLFKLKTIFAKYLWTTRSRVLRSANVIASVVRELQFVHPDLAVIINSEEHLVLIDYSKKELIGMIRFSPAAFTAQLTFNTLHEIPNLNNKIESLIRVSMNNGKGGVSVRNLPLEYDADTRKIIESKRGTKEPKPENAKPLLTLVK